MQLLQAVEEDAGRIALSIECIQLVDQVFEQQVHILVIAYAQVDISPGGLKRDALPGVKRELQQLLMRHRIDMLAEHPEARVRAAEVEVLHLGKVAATSAFDRLKVLVRL